MTFSSLSFKDPHYPEPLRQIDESPKTLWYQGDLSLLSGEKMIAIVGARECSPYGHEVAFQLAKDLVKAGVTVVSGLALGIDTAAHHGALAGGGQTIAVLGCGLDIPYPERNLDLKQEIAEKGLVVSEFSPGMGASRWTFPRRNRIISGLCRGVVVVEAGIKSGSLITAEWALQQGREVFAVPGPVSSPSSQGTHHLIQNGAKLITGVGDILEELSWSQKSDLQKMENQKVDLKELQGTHEEKQVLTLLAAGPRNMDELIDEVGFPVQTMSEILMSLELDGKVKSLPGSRFERV